MAEQNTSSNASQLSPPLVRWAQRKDKLLLTIVLEDCLNPTMTLKDNSLYFRGKGGTEQKEYEILMEFTKEVDPEASKQRVTAREIFFSIAKKDTGFWPRLLKDSGKKVHWLKTDFNKWVDEDEEDEGNADTDDFNFEDMMQSMGGMQGNAGGAAEDGEDSDDEDLPDLEGST